MAETIIIGDGVIGLSAALALLRAGHDVLLVGDGAPSAASLGNAGHIATEQVAPLASWAAVRSLPGRLWPRGVAAFPLAGLPAWLPFGMELLEAARTDRFEAGKRALSGLMAPALPAWQRLAASLPGEPLLRESGHLLLWENAETAALGLARWQASDTGTALFAPASAADLAAVRAVTPHASAGIRFTGTAQIRSLPRLMQALRDAIIAAGGRLTIAQARTTMQGRKLAVSVNNGPPHTPDMVLVAAGAQSGQLLRPAGHRVPLIAERGYHLRWQAGGWPDDLPPLVFEDRSLIAARFETYVQASSFVEFAPFSTPPDPRKWQWLERQIAALGLPADGPFSRWMGARPTLPDYLPAIGRSRRADNLAYAIGHQHLGLTLAPITAERLVQMLAGGAAEPAFDLDRF